MVRRTENHFLRCLVAIVASFAFLTVAFGSPRLGNFTPNFTATLSHVISQSDQPHVHDFDEVSFFDNDIDNSNHHHPDHSHEKAGLVFSQSGMDKKQSRSFVSIFSNLLPDRPPYEIERPPRIIDLA